LDRLARTHGMSKTTEYGIWSGIKSRCYNPHNASYIHYGARGIVMCDRWLVSFSAFFQDMGTRPTPLHSIERHNNDGPYGPENCCWALPNEQANNTRKNRLLTHNGQTQTMTQWARATSLSTSTIRHRLNAGWNIKQILETPGGA
jgi:hypothetical protein